MMCRGLRKVLLEQQVRKKISYVDIREYANSRNLFFCTNEYNKKSIGIQCNWLNSGFIVCDRKYITRYWAESTKKKIHDSKINEWREQFPILNEYDDKDLTIWREAFNKMDKDKDNFISHADLQKSDWSLEKYNLFQNYDMDKNNLIDFGEYIQAIIDIDTQYFKNFFQGFSKIDIELEFQKYAITEKEENKKVIPLTKLMQMLKDKEFTCVTETDSLKLFNAMDLNKDGALDFEDFLGVCTKKGKNRKDVPFGNNIPTNFINSHIKKYLSPFCCWEKNSHPPLSRLRHLVVSALGGHKKKK